MRIQVRGEHIRCRDAPVRNHRLLRVQHRRGVSNGPVSPTRPRLRYHFSMAAANRRVTLSLPGPLYRRVEQRALEAHRSVEAEIVETVAAAVAPEELSPDLVEAMEGLAVLDDDALWRAARLRVPEEVSDRVQDLHWKRQSTGLEAGEEQELSRLLRVYEKTMLVRAQSAKLLQERGYEVRPALLAE